jgi:transposase
MRRHELSDDQYALLVPLLPAARRPGRPWADHRRLLNGLFWKLHTGAQWRDIPERYGSWKTIYDRFVRWRRDGTWDRILQALQMRLDADGRIDGDQWCIDGTSIRASRSAAGARKRGGATPTNPPTMPSAARGVASEPSSTS